MKRFHINEKYVTVNLTRSITMYSLLPFYCAYLCYDNMRRGVISIGLLALMCTITTAIALCILIHCKLTNKPHKLLQNITIIVMCFVYWITFGIFLYTGGTGGTSIFLFFAAAPVCFYFFNLFYGSFFCLVWFVVMVIYFNSPLKDTGYQFPEMYYSRLPMMYLIEIIMAALAQYQAVHAEIKQEQAAEEARFANEAKTDFLANMSHEIRTPMNSILGFCDLILREDGLTKKVRDYSLDIQSSGRNLLYIINDILDISKIEAGKLEIIKDDFEPASLIRDVINAAMARRGAKKLEIVVDVDNDLPRRMHGDMGRIRQIMINLVTNAIKYTQTGGVYIHIYVEKSEETTFNVRVEDTGIGIEQKNLEKIFQSFEQVDTKRNRSIEGTGLGLAISRRLADLMGGSIRADSEYGKGSVFTLQVPVMIIDENPLVTKDEFKEVKAGICTDIAAIDPKMSVIYDMSLDSICDLFDMKRLDLPNSKDDHDSVYGELTHLFVDAALYEKNRMAFDGIAGNAEIIIISDSFARDELPKNKKAIYKPLYSLSVASFFGSDTSRIEKENDAKPKKRFTAPSARILIVDDNPVNLRVESGLLDIYGMTIRTASSGYEALDIVAKERFDIIFMDHMMPEMDGVETVQKMKERDLPFNNDTPIIALTANAIGGVKDMFLSHGFADFLSKPVDIEEMDKILRQYLPESRVIESEGIEFAPSSSDDDSDVLEFAPDEQDEELSQTAIKMLEDSDLIDYEVAKRYKLDRINLSIYSEQYDKTKDELERFYNAKDWKNYNIRVHALKSSSRMIGAIALSDLAKSAEDASGKADESALEILHPDVLAKYTEVYEFIAKVMEA